MKRLSKDKITDQLISLMEKVYKKKYHMSPVDVFALGYMFGKYDLKDWSQGELMRGCSEYDKLDDLGLLDTIGETLIDMGWLDNSEGKI